MAVIGTQAVKVQQEIMGADSRTWSPTGKMVGTDPATYAPQDSFLVYTPPGVTLAQADAEVDEQFLIGLAQSFAEYVDQLDD